MKTRFLPNHLISKIQIVQLIGTINFVKINVFKLCKFYENKISYNSSHQQNTNSLAINKKESCLCYSLDIFCLKGIESLPQNLIFYSLHLLNPMSYTFDISNYEFCQKKQKKQYKFEILKVYTIKLLRKLEFVAKTQFPYL